MLNFEGYWIGLLQYVRGDSANDRDFSRMHHRYQFRSFDDRVHSHDFAEI